MSFFKRLKDKFSGKSSDEEKELKDLDQDEKQDSESSKEDS